MTPAEIAKEARNKAKEWIRIEFPDLTIQEKIANYADIIATSLNGEEYYFEVKGTEKDSNNFGAATLTECSFAVNAVHYYFLLVNITKRDPNEAVKKRTLDEMFPYMSVPPFKINFNIREHKRKQNKGKADDVVVVDKKMIMDMEKFYYGRIKPKNDD